MDKITQTFMADAFRVIGPKEDGGLTVSFQTGQDQQLEVAKLLALPQKVRLKITVDYEPSEVVSNTPVPTQEEYFEKLAKQREGEGIS